jgi:hypothetical protein
MSLEPIKSSAPARGSSVGGRRKSVGEEPVSSVLRAGEVITYERELTADEEVLAALGYKPEFKREFSLWTSFCVSFAVLGLLPSFASTLYYGMPERLITRSSFSTPSLRSLVSPRGPDIIPYRCTSILTVLPRHGIRRHTRNGLGLGTFSVRHRGMKWR